MIVVAGFIRDGEHPFDVVLGVRLRHPLVVPGGYEGTEGLQFVQPGVEVKAVPAGNVKTEQKADDAKPGNGQG